MPELPEIDVQGTIRAAGDSEDLVLRLVNEGVHDQEIHDTIKRNTDHLKIILAKQEIIDSESPKLADFEAAVELGEAFIAAE